MENEFSIMHATHVKSLTLTDSNGLPHLILAKIHSSASSRIHFSSFSKFFILSSDFIVKVRSRGNMSVITDFLMIF
jgi:hypothetical protein